MSESRWSRLVAIVNHLLDHPSEDQTSALYEAFPDDPGARREAAQLLAVRTTDLEPIDALVATEERGLSGTRIGHYLVERLAGEGAMGAVYLARDMRLERSVALKVLKTGVANVAMHEHLIIAGLTHPNVASIYDSGRTDQGQEYLVMEWIDGAPLDQYIARERLDSKALLRLFVAICQAVHFAHNNLVVHRDIKPQNILVTTEGIPKLLDFGIAKRLSEDQAATAPHQRRLTPRYASPEQVSGEFTGTSSDTYSLGVLLSELLTGQLPYPESDSPAVLSHIVGGHVIAPSQQNASGLSGATSLPRSQLVGDLDAIVLKALRTEPDERYSSVQALADDVERHLQRVPVLARPGTRRYKAKRFLMRHAGIAFVTGLAIVVLTVVVALLAVQRSEARQQRDRANEEARRAGLIVDYLTSLFEVGHPWSGEGESLTPDELLDRGLQQLDEQLQEEAQDKAALLVTLANLFLTRGAFNRAQTAMERAQSLAYEDISGETRLALLILNSRLALHANDFSTARIAAHQALVMATKAGLSDTHAESLLANIDYRTGDYESARIRYEAVLHELRALPGSRSDTLCEALGNYAGILLKLEDYEKARGVFDEAQVVASSLLASDSESVVRMTEKIAHHFYATGHFDDAAVAFGQVARYLEEAGGSQSPFFAKNLHNLASSARGAGRHDEAIPIFERSLELKRALFGASTLEVAQTLDALGVVYGHLGRLASARSVFEEAFAIRASALGADHPKLAFTHSNLASIETRSGRHGQALGGFREAARIFRKTFGEEHSTVSTTLSNLGKVYAEVGHVEEARSHYLQAIAAAPDDSHYEARAKHNLAVLERDLGELDSSLGRLEEALQTLYATVGSAHWSVGYFASTRASVLMLQGDGEAALRVAREAQELMKRVGSQQRKEHAIVDGVLGSIACEVGDREEGRGLLAESVSRLDETARESSVLVRFRKSLRSCSSLPL